MRFKRFLIEVMDIRGVRHQLAERKYVEAMMKKLHIEDEVEWELSQ